MATEKTWMASDIKCRSFHFIRHQSEETQQDILTIAMEYYFIDSEGDNIGALTIGRCVRNLPVASIPDDIKQAFLKLHNYMRNEALKDQGME